MPKQQFVNWEESPATFTIDINGDYRNLEDKTNYEVPTYFLPENRIALGSKTGLGPVAHRPALPNRSNNSISQQIVKDVKHQNMLRINAKATPRSEVGEAADYVPLRQSKLRKRKWVDPTEEETSPKTLGNRPHNLIGSESGLGSAPLADNEYTTDMTSSDDDSARTLMLDKGKRQRRATLSSQVEQEPSKWQTWLALVGVQDEMDGLLGVSSQLSHTTAERRSNAEIDLSIYEKALRSVTDPEGRERLYLGMMSKAPLVWETSKTSSKWQMILNEHPASQKLWKRYLRFHQSLWSAFSVEETRKHYLDCLNMLRGVRESVNVELNLHSRIYFVQVYILLRLTLLLREGDYSELAVAIWQALLEFEFNKPYHLRCPAQQRPCRTRYDESLSAFETFWESEAPRIGEANAKGWLNYQDGDDEQEPPPAAVEPLPRPDSSALETWADAEREAHNSSKTPSRSIDGSGEDLYKVVFFSDIKPALIESPTCSDHHAILAAFLCFCHLPPYANDPTHYMGVWYNDQFVRNELLYDESSLKRPRPFKADNAAVNGECHASSTAADNMYDPSPPDLFAFPLAEHPVSSETLFSAPGRWFSVFERRLQIGGPVPTEFILATLKTITNQGVGDDDLAEYLLAFELQVSPATVLKSAKSLLRKRPSSLRLYNAYALVHNQLGNVEMANTVFDTAIQSSVKLDDVARRDVVVLWRSRIWKDLESGQTTLALDRLLQFDLEGGTKGRADDNGNVLDMKSATSYLRLQNVGSLKLPHFCQFGRRSKTIQSSPSRTLTTL